MTPILQQALSEPSVTVRYFLMAGRIVALCIGCLAMYIAFFQYGESTEGRLQNLIEDFWVAVDDRARQTGSLSIALFNRVAVVVQRLFNWLFAERTFSLRLVTVAANVAVFASIFLFFLLNGVGGMMAFLSPTILIITLIPLGSAAVSICFHRRWVYVLSTSLTLCVLAYFAPKILGFDRLLSIDALFTLVFPMLLSLASDLLALATIKWSLGLVAAERSLLAILIRLLAVSAVVAITLCAPVLLLLTPSNQWWWWLENILIILSLMNASTAIYCLIPIVVFVFVLFHRALWPALSRLIFPIARFELVKNRKALAAIGSLGILVGLGMKETTPEAILKLFE